MSARLYELKEMLCCELDKLAVNGELSTGELETMHKLTSTLKNLNKIIMLEESGYSNDGEWSASGNYNRGNSYRGNSYRGYSREGEYSERGRYSRASEQIGIEQQLRELMENGNISPSQKSAYKKAIDILHNA